MSKSFRTELHLPPHPHPLGLSTRVLTAGSCFAEVMGRKLTHYKVPALVNPFGNIYNPLSLFRLLQQCLLPQPQFQGEMVERDGLWYAYDLHSDFSAPSRKELVDKITQTLAETRDFLLQADVLILTFGTALGYVHLESGNLVANCHKVAQNQFRKQLLDLGQMQAGFATFYQDLQAVNPDLRIMVTVSPVRHLKETLEGNSVSKSLLRVFCHELTRRYPAVTYFPAYELLLDDLRDYRFYQVDMIHPTPVAEDYIWDKFKAAYFDQAFRDFTAEWDKLTAALTHRPFHPESPAHQAFLRATLSRLEKLSDGINCFAEIALVRSQLR